MSFPRRQDFGVRGAGEKAQVSDEWLTRSQVIQGQNIWFEYLANHDIRINALAGGGGGGSDIDCCKRMITAEIQMNHSNDYYLENFFNQTSGNRHISTMDNVNGVASDRRQFGTKVSFDIAHNWNLSKQDAFISNIMDLRRPPAGTYSTDSKPRIVGIDENRVRIYFNDIPAVFGSLTFTVPGDITQGNTTIACSSTTNLRVGMPISGNGIPENSRILSINPGTSFMINNYPTQTGTGVTITINMYRANGNTIVGRTPQGGLNILAPHFRVTIIEYKD